MAWALIELVEEIKDRVTKAKTVGGVGLKDIFIGDFHHARLPNDYPIVVIAPLSFEVLPKAMGRICSESSEIAIVYMTNRKTENNNKLYKTGDTSGALYDLAKILNYLELKTTDQSVDLTVNAKAFNMARPRIDFDYSNDDLVRVTITYAVETATYTRGAR